MDLPAPFGLYWVNFNLRLPPSWMNISFENGHGCLVLTLTFPKNKHYSICVHSLWRWMPLCVLVHCFCFITKQLSVFWQVLNPPKHISRPFSNHCISLTLPNLLSEDHTSLPAQNSSGVTGLSFFSPHASAFQIFFLPCLFWRCPSRLFSLCYNKNNRLWSAFSCSITHRHQPPHAIRLSRETGVFSAGAGVHHACHLVVREEN